VAVPSAVIASWTVSSTAAASDSSVVAVLAVLAVAAVAAGSLRWVGTADAVGPVPPRCGE
jgi:hypothetical protein